MYAKIARNTRDRHAHLRSLFLTAPLGCIFRRPSTGAFRYSSRFPPTDPLRCIFRCPSTGAFRYNSHFPPTDPFRYVFHCHLTGSGLIGTASFLKIRCSVPMSRVKCNPVWGFPLSFIDGKTSYIKGFTLSPEPSERRGIPMLPCNPPEIVIFSSFFEVVSLRRICVTDYQRPVCRCVNLSRPQCYQNILDFL